MRKIIIINLILIFLIHIIPVKKETVTSNVATNMVIQEQTQVTNRSDNYRVEEIPVANLEITVDSDLRILSNLKAEDYNKMLSGTKLAGLGNALEQAEKEHGVNGLYLMGLACLESSYGNSSFARNRNNLVGWGAYDSNPNKAKYFSSKDECILFVAEKLKKNYLTKGGTYFEGYSAKDVDKHYCTDKQHANKIINIINKLKGEL